MRPPYLRTSAGSLEAVVAHPGQHHQQQTVAVDLGGVLDREVGAGTQATDLRLVAELRATVRRQPQVRAAGGQQRGPRIEPLAAAASRTCRADARSRRAASDPVKPGGMCWTISVPMPSGDGSLGTSAASARGPPVEVAITTARAVRLRGARVGTVCAGGVAARAAERRSAGWPAAPDSAAIRTLLMRLCAKPSRPSPADGFATRSNAPSASASTARAPCEGENAETTTTGSAGPRRVFSR